MGIKRNYKTEMKMLKEHRKKYLPAVVTLLNYHNNKAKHGEHIEFKDTAQKLILAELIDVGYLDPTVVVIDKYFESIDKVFYTFEYPLTPKGEVFYYNEIKAQQSIFNKKRRIKLLILLGGILAIASIIFLLSK
jgi:hypothetical protein